MVGSTSGSEGPGRPSSVVLATGVSDGTGATARSLGLMAGGWLAGSGDLLGAWRAVFALSELAADASGCFTCDQALRTPSPLKSAADFDQSADRAEDVASSARRKQFESAFLAALALDPSPPSGPTPRLRPCSLDSPFATLPGRDEMLATPAATTAMDKAVPAPAPAAVNDEAALPSNPLEENHHASTTPPQVAPSAPPATSIVSPLLLPRSEQGPAAASQSARPTMLHDGRGRRPEGAN
ncbi:MAG: hypothetical protein M1826_002667 [Phylliscum demangeonii]|nr:MAG: hypothetical protein M1826_002667 [Phylliscum demangeonii]